MSSGCRRYFYADALLWTVREGAAENWVQIITPMGFWASSEQMSARRRWWMRRSIGGRVFESAWAFERRDGFDMTLYYTNFFTSATSQASGEVYSAFMGNFYIDNTDGGDYGPYYRHASIQWDFNFHSIDFEISRNYTIGDELGVAAVSGAQDGDHQAIDQDQLEQSGRHD